MKKKKGRHFSGVKTLTSKKANKDERRTKWQIAARKQQESSGGHEKGGNGLRNLQSLWREEKGDWRIEPGEKSRRGKNRR